ncbi:DUF424 family protein [Candidatus Micrarchaeota archaeon]|nr:DUF424 family protein [Candidatus Micrarchaeota archaeon]
MLYLKIHENPRGKIVAVCDEELIGKVLEDKNHFMDLDKHRNFYIGEKVNAEKVKEALKNFGSVNLVGKNSVKVALDMSLVTKEEVIYINRIPHIQIYNIQ